jgi:hypothetical protein
VARNFAVGNTEWQQYSQQIGAKHGHGNGEQSHARAAPVVHVDHVGNCTHGAEIRLGGDKAENQGRPEATPDDPCRQIYGFAYATPS